MMCRHCAADLDQGFLDLGFAPPSNAYLTPEQLRRPEITLPLRLFVCTRCWLVQTEDFAAPEDLFAADYAYFSSTSSSWLDHARHYAQMITRRLALDGDSLVIEVASNDGYLLRNFVAAGIPCLGIEPTRDTAEAAERLGIPVLRAFFGRGLGERLAAEGRQADLIIGNNVYAHVSDINDFTAGLQAALKPDGVITLEFPHLLRMIAGRQFDTAYHEHFSYLSLTTVARIFHSHGLRIWDVEELPTHGGSLRIYGCHAEDARPEAESVGRMMATERAFGLFERTTYAEFQAIADGIRNNLLGFLVDERRRSTRIAAYGAAAKGNTLLNFAGIRPNLLPYVVDAAESKQGKFLPGSHLPVVPPAALRERRPDIVLILPWNIADEIVERHSYVRDWGGRFAVAVPEIAFL